MKKLMLRRKKKNIVQHLSNEKQKEIFRWLVAHYGGYLTPIGTWQMLFAERKANEPDICIRLYDELSYEEKMELEIAFCEYVLMER